MGSGMARGAAARGKRIAFGNGGRIYWTDKAHEIFKGNPNVAPPGSERSPDLEWIKHYVGHRRYALSSRGVWNWNYNFKVQRGEIFFDPTEQHFASTIPKGMVLIEPAVKPSAPNKQWPRDYYVAVCKALLKQGYQVAHFERSGHPLDSQQKLLRSTSFRLALAQLSRMSLYIGPEGGLHHGAAALNIPAVVIFGGFISPKLTGYEDHTNLSDGGLGCGVYGRKCPHCRSAMEAIKPQTVIDAALFLLKGGPNAVTRAAETGSGILSASV